MSNNLTDMPQIAEAIHEVLDREIHNREEWVLLKLDLCRLFYKAKMTEKSNAKFGEWQASNFPELNIQDRAAYVGMGADITKAEQVLRNTERTSMQHIFGKEFSVRIAGKTKAKAGSHPGARAGATSSAPSAVKPPLTAKEFALLMMVVHPDTGANVTAEKRTEAAAILNKHREALIGGNGHQKAEKAKAKAAKAAKPTAEPAHG